MKRKEEMPFVNSRKFYEKETYTYYLNDTFFQILIEVCAI